MGWQDGTPVAAAEPAWKQGKPVRPATETPQFEKDAADIANATPAQLIAGHPATRFAIGAADMIRGGAQRVGNMVGLGQPLNENETALQALIDAGRKAYGSEGFDAMRTMGDVVNPVNLAVARAMPAATTAGGRIGMGSGAGFIGGSLTPVAGATDTADYLAKGAVNQGIGAGVGAAVPAGWEAIKAGGRTLRNIVDDVLTAAGNQASANRQGGRLANAAAGPRAAQVIDALENSQNIVPGSNLTAGQASVPANSAEFAALQKIAQQSNPSLYAGPQGIEAAQEAARRNALQTVGQTPQALEAAQAARASAAQQNYGAAYQQQVRADPQLAQMAQNPYFKDAMVTAEKLAEAKGIDPKANLTEFLQLVKFGLDKQLSRTGDTALIGEERKAAYAAKRELVDWMGKKNAAYDFARKEFAAASNPINQMEVGQELEKALATPVQNAGERPGVFANAVNNAGRTIKAATGATGGPRYDKLEEVLTPSQVKTVQMVMRDLTNDAQFENLAKQGASQAGKITGRQLDTITQVPTLNPTVKLFNFFSRHLEGLGGEKALQKLAVTMQNPKEMARLMREATPAERKEIVDIVMRMGAGASPQVAKESQ